MERLLILRRASFLHSSPALHQRGASDSVYMRVDGCVQTGVTISSSAAVWHILSQFVPRLILLNWFTTEVFYFLPPARISVPATLHICLCASLSVSWPLNWTFYINARGQRVEWTMIFWSAVGLVFKFKYKNAPELKIWAKLFMKILNVYFFNAKYGSIT